MKKSAEGFEEGLRRDLVKRFKAAIHKLNDQAVDLEVEAQRDRAETTANRRLGEVDNHIWTLRYAAARAIVSGDVYLGPNVKAALAAADGRVPKPKPPKPPRPVKGLLGRPGPPPPQTLMLPLPRLILDAELEEDGDGED